VLSSIFMLNNNKDYGKIKKLCQKRLGYSHSKRIGCNINREPDNIIGLLTQLGMTAKSTEDGIEFRTFAELSGYSRGLLLIYFGDTDHGHCVAWDGYRIFDPNHTAPTTEKMMYAKYGKDLTFSFFTIETRWFVRLVNMIKSPFFELRCARMEAHIEDD